MHSDPARVQICRDGASVQARLSGPVNRDMVPVFQAALERAAARPTSLLVLDLGEAEYVDSDGIRWLQRLQHTLQVRGTDLLLALREGCRAQRTLSLLRLESCFETEIYPSDAAPASVRSEPRT